VPSNQIKQSYKLSNGKINNLLAENRVAHDWYRFVLSFPPHLVEQYLQKFKVTREQCVLDPFCGTGTTLVECKKYGVASVGIEAHPMAYFASQVKTDWTPDPDGLLEHSYRIAEIASNELEAAGIEDNPFFPTSIDNTKLRLLPTNSQNLLITNSISPLPLHKTLVLLDHLKRQVDERYITYELLALAKALVYTISNLHFGPEVGVSSIKQDAPVIASWLTGIRAMANDLYELQSWTNTPVTVHCFDSRQVLSMLEPESIDVVITSPPYPNEKDYTRTTRLETVLLEFIHDKKDLQALKRNLMRSNTRNVYKEDDDDLWVASYPQIQDIAEAIEARRIELGKTSGFERLYAKVTRLYFGGLMRHLANLRQVLRPGAQLAYVVGDQASYLRIKIPTGQLLANLAQSLGYELISIELFRTRLSTVTKEQLREEIVVLKWPGKGKNTLK